MTERLSERMRRIEENIGLIDESNLPPLPPLPPTKKKRFGIPFRGKVGRVRARRGWVTVIKILDNKNLDFDKQQVQDQTVMVDGLPRIVTPEDILMYRGKPAVIIPSYTVKAYNPKDHYEDVLKSQLGSQGHKLLLARMLGEVIQTKKKMSMMVVFIILIVLIAGGYFLSKSGAFG